MWRYLTGGLTKSSPEVLGPNLWSWFLSLPADYRDFLMEHNGGRPSGGAYTFTVNIPYLGDREKLPSIENFVELFLPIQAAAERHTMGDLVECNEFIHSAGSVPPDAIAIADCDGSLACLSLRPREFGVVYYWEYYADYPWHKEFFRKRRREVIKKFEDGEAILDDPSHFEYMTLLREVQWSRLVRLAGSFTEWVAMLKVRAQ